MSKKNIYLITSLLFILFIHQSKYCMAQENSGKQEPFSPYHQVALVLSHSHIFEGIDEEGKRNVLSLPSWGIDYTFVFRPKWAVGLHTDIIIEKFKVEKEFDDGETIERSYPVAPAVMGIFKPFEHWSFLLGMGGEFAKEENFVLTRAGVEYGAEISKDWEVTGNVCYDFKWNAYDTWGVGIGIAKSFGK